MSSNIRKWLGQFFIDNASTNDTLMEYIAEDLKEEKFAYDLRQFRLRCKSHIINLAI